MFLVRFLYEYVTSTLPHAISFFSVRLIRIKVMSMELSLCKETGLLSIFVNVYCVFSQSVSQSVSQGCNPLNMLAYNSRIKLCTENNSFYHNVVLLNQRTNFSHIADFFFPVCPSFFLCICLSDCQSDFSVCLFVFVLICQLLRSYGQFVHVMSVYLFV